MPFLLVDEFDEIVISPLLAVLIAFIGSLIILGLVTMVVMRNKSNNQRSAAKGKQLDSREANEVDMSIPFNEMSTLYVTCVEKNVVVLVNMLTSCKCLNVNMLYNL